MHYSTKHYSALHYHGYTTYCTPIILCTHSLALHHSTQLYTTLSYISPLIYSTLFYTTPHYTPLLYTFLHNTALLFTILSTTLRYPLHLLPTSLLAGSALYVLPVSLLATPTSVCRSQVVVFVSKLCIIYQCISHCRSLTISFKIWFTARNYSWITLVVSLGVRTLKFAGFVRHNESLSSTC